MGKGEGVSTGNVNWWRVEYLGVMGCVLQGGQISLTKFDKGVRWWKV